MRAHFDEVVETGRLLPTTVVLPEIIKKSDVFTYLVTPQFKVDRSLMIYGRVATGYMPGRSHSFNSRSEEHTSELQSLMRNSYAVFCFKKYRIKFKLNTAKR